MAGHRAEGMIMTEKIYRLPERKTIYKQGEGPWKEKPYPDDDHPVKRSGCGLLSVTHLALERDKYADVTPLYFYDFMDSYARAGKGTLRTGILKGMEEIGLQYIKHFEGDLLGGNMKDFYREMKKGDRISIILFQNPKRKTGGETKAKDGTVWTRSGHYVAICGMKKVNRLYYLFCKDSSGKHNGWYSYIKSMKGQVCCMWTGKIPAEKIDLPEKGYFEYGDSSPEIIKLQEFLKKRKYFKGKPKGNFRKLTKAALIKFEKEFGLEPDGIFGPKCLRLYEELEGL